jgi:hypothetical protein
MAVMVENASASTTPALKRNFIGKTPPAEVVNGRQAALGVEGILARAKIGIQHVEPRIDLRIAEKIRSS